MPVHKDSNFKGSIMSNVDCLDKECVGRTPSHCRTFTISV